MRAPACEHATASVQAMRMMKYVPAAGVALVAVVFAFAASRKPRGLECDRTTCTYGEATFPFTEVREVRFVDGFGKNGTQGETQIILASGNQINVARADSDEARASHGHIQAFFAPGGAPSLTLMAASMWWGWLLAAGCAIASVVIAMRARNRPEVHREPEQKRADWAKRKRFLLIGAGAVVAIAIVQLAILFIASKVQGTLILECEQRCRFQGLECLPGGSSRQSLAEGTYEIEIWAASGSALWIPKTFAIKTGETTTYVCR